MLLPRRFHFHTGPYTRPIVIFNDIIIIFVTVIIALVSIVMNIFQGICEDVDECLDDNGGCSQV